MIQQKIQANLTRLVLLMLSVIAIAMSGSVYAATPTTPPGCVIGNEKTCPGNTSSCSTKDAQLNNCTDPAASGGGCTSTANCNLLTQYLQPFINFLSALVGVAVTISIVIGGIQYGSSAGDPSKVSAAKNRIRNSIIALIAFVLLYAMLNFLIPGGLV